jgi:hypothetical protein
MLLFFAGERGIRQKPCFAETENRRVTIDLQSEDRDVGLKRMEILEKSLSPEIIQRKRELARSLEEEYNRKIAELVQRLTTSIGRNTVITSVNIRFFDPGFDREIQGESDVSVTVLLDRDGLAKWSSGKASESAAIEEMRTLIHRAFQIPQDRITILVAPN